MLQNRVCVNRDRSALSVDRPTVFAWRNRLIASVVAVLSDSEREVKASEQESRDCSQKQDDKYHSV
jgi:hypothetical protein